MYHDSVLFRILYAHAAKDAAAIERRGELTGGEAPRLSLHARYTNHWRSKPTYRNAGVLLMVLEATQLLAEMLARRRLGRARAWDIVLAIELAKALLRFALVRASQQRMLIQPPLPQREIDPSTLEPSESRTWRGTRTGCVRRSLASLGSGDVYEYLLEHTLTEQDVAAPPQLVRPLHSHMARIAESLYILRPLLYVIALRRWGTRNVRPWALSLIVELLARTLRKRALVIRDKDAPPLPPPAPSSVSLLLNMLGIENSFLDWLATSFSGRPTDALLKPVSYVEAGEWAQRDRSFWWYLLRGPVWFTWTRPKVAALAASLERRRLVRLLGSILRDYLPLVDEYYYYSSV